MSPPPRADKLLDRGASRDGALATTMILVRTLDPRSKLITALSMRSDTLGEETRKRRCSSWAQVVVVE